MRMGRAATTKQASKARVTLGGDQGGERPTELKAVSHNNAFIFSAGNSVCMAQFFFLITNRQTDKQR